MGDRLDKEKIAALSRAVMRNKNSKTSQKYYHEQAIAVGKKRKKEREKSRAERILASMKEKK
jgi:hypothetical protein